MGSGFEQEEVIPGSVGCIYVQFLECPAEAVRITSILKHLKSYLIGSIV